MGRLIPIMKFSPFIPLFGGGNSNIQPVFIDDVAKAVELLLEKQNYNKSKKIYEIYGREIFTYSSLYLLIGNFLNIKRIYFFFPFLFLMTRASKRFTRFLKIACPVVLFGHFIDFYLMVTPGVLKENGGFGFLEIGILMIFLSAFLYVVLNGLKKLPLVAKNHPMLEESLYHDI